MTNPFATALRIGANMTRTENNAATHKTSGSSLLDFFASGGAWRSRTESDITRTFELAFCENPVLALRCLFYLRDIRGGQGERRLFRVILQHLLTNHPDAFRKILPLVPEFGRWDDVLHISGAPIVAGWLKNQLEKDIIAEKPSLLAKWLPSENTTSKGSVTTARSLIKAWGWKPRVYRKALSGLREKLRVLERDMCAKNWGAINYQHVPSRASLKYRKAFKKNDEARYTEYIGQVKKGEKKIHAGTLYPYDLVREVWTKSGDETIDAQWAALPNYFTRPTNALVMCDTSGSMNTGDSPSPMQVARSLALYIAERNQGPFHNLYMSFSMTPELVQVGGNTLFEKIQRFQPIIANTDLMAAFREILKYAKHVNAAQSDLPEMLIVISDMEFDSACNSSSQHSGGTAWSNYQTRAGSAVSPGERTNFQQARVEFERAGYKLPTIVFWNVAARNDQQPVTMHQSGAVLVSGASPAILKHVLNPGSELHIPTPFELMVETLNSERYSKITLEN